MSNPLITEQGFRADGRKPGELRQFTAKLGIIPGVDGSSSLSQGNEKLLVTICGPREAPRSAAGEHCVINCQLNQAAFSQNERRRPHTSRKEYDVAHTLSQIFQAVVLTTSYPGSQLDINIQVMQSDGSLLSSCVNGIMLALTDAGIPVRHFVAACSAAAVGDAEVLDTTQTEETQSSGHVELVTWPQTGEIVYLQTSNKMHIDYLQKLLDVATDGARQISAVLAGAVKEHVAATAASLS